MPVNLMDLISNAAARYGLDEDYLARVAKIESGMNPNARTGSYRGVFQLSPSEFARGGGRGNIYDPEQNTNAAASIMAAQREAFRSKYGRDPTPTEAYMIHQQGSGGLDMHLANPDRPAWENMYNTAEGQQRGIGWAKAAIWGNVPDQMKAQFGNVNNVTSGDFVNKVWGPKFEGLQGQDERATGSPAGLPVQAREVLQERTPQVAERNVATTPQDTSAMGPRPAYAEQLQGLGDAKAMDFKFQLPSAESPLARLQSPGVNIRLAALPAAPSLLARYGRV